MFIKSLIGLQLCSIQIEPIIEFYFKTALKIHKMTNIISPNINQLFLFSAKSYQQLKSLLLLSKLWPKRSLMESAK